RQRSGPQGQGVGVSFFSSVFLDKQENRLARQARRPISADLSNRRVKSFHRISSRGNPFEGQFFVHRTSA
ncbi:hypothetical protein, partial [Guyparkeria sp.]|uniref:hypothetical protein n=1 Tax=Guyparkeria sp. TaxID=2035736 RepID=UPI0035614B1A